MPYQHIEEIGDRSQERFALGLSAQNVLGIVVCGFPLFTISAAWPLALRLPTVVFGLALGLIATVEVGGLPLYAWPLWWLRGRIRMLAQGRRIVPEQLQGVALTRVAAPLRVGGPLRAARRTLGPRPQMHLPEPSAEATSENEHADL